MSSTRIFCLFTLAIATEANAIFIALDGDAIDTAKSLGLSPLGPPGSIGVQLANESTSSSTLTVAQVALTVVPLAGATGSVAISADPSFPSLFGVPVTDISSTSGIVTLQAGGFPGASLAAGLRGAFASVELTPTPDASGDFELVAIDLNMSDLLASSHWSAPGLPPALIPYENAFRASDGLLLLARLNVVPEPSGAISIATLTLGVLLLRLRRVRM